MSSLKRLGRCGSKNKSNVDVEMKNQAQGQVVNQQQQLIKPMSRSNKFLAKPGDLVQRQSMGRGTPVMNRFVALTKATTKELFYAVDQQHDDEVKGLKAPESHE